MLVALAPYPSFASVGRTLSPAQPCSGPVRNPFRHLEIGWLQLLRILDWGWGSHWQSMGPPQEGGLTHGRGEQALRRAGERAPGAWLSLAGVASPSGARLEEPAMSGGHSRSHYPLFKPQRSRISETGCCQARSPTPPASKMAAASCR